MIFFLTCLVALGLLSLVTTSKIRFPILFDAGMTVVALGAIVWADGAEKGILMRDSAALMFASGIGLMTGAYIRHRLGLRKRRAHSRSGPFAATRLGDITGGKRS